MAKDQMQPRQPQGLTLNDPVSPEEMARIDELDLARTGIANQNLVVDQEKIKLLGAARRVDAEYQRAFDKILVDRGLPPGTRIALDKNNRVRLLQEIPENPPVQTKPEGVATGTAGVDEGVIGVGDPLRSGSEEPPIDQEEV